MPRFHELRAPYPIAVKIKVAAKGRVAERTGLLAEAPEKAFVVAPRHAGKGVKLALAPVDVHVAIVLIARAGVKRDGDVEAVLSFFLEYDVDNAGRALGVESRPGVGDYLHALDAGRGQ